MTENNQPLTIAVTELIKEASRIKEFRGDKSYDLSAFIREVELILPLFNENRPLQEFIFQRYIRTKIQGAALNAIRTLGQSPSWTTIREELIRNFGIKETYHNLYHQAISTKNNNVLSISMPLIFVMLIMGATATMITEDIKNEDGLAEIKLENVQVITDFDIILHIIRPQEIENIIDALENLARDSKLTEKEQILTQEFTTLRSKLYTLLPHKQKRGLINILGTTMKWLYGTMDDDDRQNIEQHLKKFEKKTWGINFESLHDRTTCSNN
ncbi:PREDICTED: uncharacterized protein LOC108361515 [Rhagoletis zephyria]|uniref:uncharacterized protein LOC108361515 n=1 Tax=Rhagoletis zephyria TaxID=28612 RepID=UPI0008113BE1|nr:PREDICTED: uncharacterized protein LOC108361515 [Rhagoletis zephyria]